MATTIGSLDLNAFSDLYSDSTQYFWFESNSSATYGAGAHVTLVPDTTFISNPTGQNILMNTDGFSIRNGLLPMMTLDNDSLDFNVVDTTAGTYVTTATFTSTGAQIGQSSGAHSVIDADGQRFYASNGSTLLANIGYGEGASQGGTAIAPYYTFGTRASNSTIGNYSMAEGFTTTAMGYSSHAEGQSTTAMGYSSHAEGMTTTTMGAASHAEGSHTTASVANSHAEGNYTTASGIASHAEGNHTTASEMWSHAEGDYTTADGFASHAEGNYTTAGGNWSHAEGNYTTAGGTYSHAQNLFTVATENSQTVIGKYNAATVTGSGTTSDPYVYTDVGDYAFIIGNGTDNPTANRSNALTVDWDGNVEAAGDIYPQNTLMADFVVEQGTSGNWTYTKWNSGKCEQWYVGNPGLYTVGTTRGQLRSGGYLNYTYPVAFTAAPSVTVNATLTTDSYVVWAQASNHSNTGISVRIVASANISSNSNYNIHIHAVGTWK